MYDSYLIQAELSGVVLLARYPLSRSDEAISVVVCESKEIASTDGKHAGRSNDKQSAFPSPTRGEGAGLMVNYLSLIHI